MANKRQKKKQQAKQNVKQLTNLGVNRKQAERVKNRPQQVKTIVKQRNKEIKAEKRKATANERSKLIQELGFKVKDHAAKRYWTDEKFKEWYKKEQKKAKHREAQKRYREKNKEKLKQKSKGKRPAAGGQKVLILWKDVTENVGREYLEDVVESYQGASLETLIDSAKGWRDMVFGEIGTWAVNIVTDSELYQTIRMYEGYEKVYFGNGTQYKKLLEKLNFMMLAIYQPVKKELFILEVIDAFLYVNPPVAQRLAKDFEIAY
jgi:hypothetical protein